MENDRLDLDLGRGDRSVDPPYTSKIKSSIAVLDNFIVLGVCALRSKSREKYIRILTRAQSYIALDPFFLPLFFKNKGVIQQAASLIF
jgi:hypothetical protein